MVARKRHTVMEADDVTGCASTSSRRARSAQAVTDQSTGADDDKPEYISQKIG